MPNINQIIELLKKQRFPLENEKRTQSKISEILTKENIDHKREVNLSDKDIVDFMIDDIAIEVKIKGSAMSIFRQCNRYCESIEVKTLILLSSVVSGFPNQINGKDVYVINMAKAWM